MRLISLNQSTFRNAADAWLDSRKPYLAPKTIHEYELNINTLAVFFGEMRLGEITADQIRGYQRMRQTQCGPFAINHECSVLQQMLKRLGRWGEIGPQYQALPLPKELRGRALRPEERERLFKIASMSRNWDGVRLCALICINSTANPKEAFTLRLRDIDMKERKITIHSGGAKNVHRIRPIPMNEELEATCKEALARAQSMGSFLPDHYVFPFRIHSALHDPTRHQTTFKTGWNKIKAKAKEYGLDIDRLRLEDMRHHAITSLLEDPNVSEETAESLAGHIGKRTKKFYSHVRIEAQRKAVEGALSYPPKKPAISEVSTGDGDVAGLLKQLLAKLLKAS